MKALKCKNYSSGNNIEIVDLKIPTPNDNELLIRVHFSSVNTGDWRIKSLNVPRGFRLITRIFFGLFKPKRPILGTEISGVVSEIGNSVEKFKVNDEVIAMTGIKMGGHAQYICVDQNSTVMKKPINLTHEQAAICSFGGLCAYDFLVRRAKLNSDDEIMIIGASGSVGSMAIQIAKFLKSKITAVCSTKNFEYVKNLGASNVYTYKNNEHLKTDQ
ncbi:MAG: NAD(P)-dependent alcohol dehydrogenase [Halobacteriovoraceae bacterium]|nr:NAD(P)-dependent alcohol dehydrogenase [Halobacteriovoraceae bacterium]